MPVTPTTEPGKTESIADILAEVRKCANLTVCCGKCREQTDIFIIPEGMIDRIEAAAELKRFPAMLAALEKIAAMEVPHNFQYERADITDACYDLTNAIKAAKAAIEMECDRQYEPKRDWSVKDARDLANTLANHGLRDGNADAASSCIYSLCRMLSANGDAAVAQKSAKVEYPGNAAALRRALFDVEGAIMEDEPGKFWLADAEAILHEVQAALAAPSRNCDRTKDKAESAFKAKFGRSWSTGEDELATWLFAEDTSFRDAAVKQANKLADELRNLLD